MIKAKWTSRLSVALIALVLASFNETFSIQTMAANTPVSAEKQAHDGAVEAFQYAYPLVLAGITKQVMTGTDTDRADAQDAEKSPINQFLHKRGFVGQNFKNVVRPNADTLYSMAWLDLTDGPMILTVPDTQGRYFVMELMDAWTEVFADPGKRTTGTQAANFAIVGPSWKGELPAGVQKLNSATNFVWIIGRTQTNGPEDFSAVHIIQNGYKLSSLAAYVKEAGGAQSSTAENNHQASARPTPKLLVTGEPPVRQVANMNASQFFSTFAKMLLSNPPHKEDAAILAKLKVIGIEPGHEFVFDKLSAESKLGMESGVKEAKQIIEARSKSIGAHENNWWVQRKIGGNYGTNYLDRAAIALMGLGMNKLDDAVYPYCDSDSQGHPLNGQNSYVIHFDKGQLPPVKGFWSLTVYDAKGFFVPNSINRFSLGDRDNLIAQDGAVDIYVQSDNPGKDKNWLPAPKDSFNLLMRLYWPKSSVLSGLWVPPSVKKQNVKTPVINKP